jgi:ribonuclease Z
LNEELTLDPAATRSYAFCSDTRYSEKIIPYIKGVDLLYHEATFMHDMLENAELTGHSTALQAATIAKAAEVKKMIIGHFSARYSDLQALLAEAQERFPNTELAIDGTVYSIV